MTAKKVKTHQAKTYRRSGRPSSVKETVGREALIAAAKELLKTKSPSKIRRVDIAKAAGADPALVRYYFKDAGSLLASAMEEVAQDNMRRTRKQIVGPKEAAARLGIRNQLFFEMLKQNPNQGRVFYDLFLSENPVNLERPRRIMSEGLKLFGDIVSHGVERREFKDVDMRHLFIAVTGMCEFFFSSKPVLADIYGSNYSFDKVLKSYSEFMMDLILKGIAERPEKRSRPLK